MSTLPDMSAVGADIKDRLDEAESAVTAIEAALSQLQSALQTVNTTITQIKSDYQKIEDMPETADFHD
ncbi:MAG: hypothetical protein SPH18_07180 [Sutterella parvirubra]|nr:hypothetical protein [Sutterella parvirubra]